MTDSLQANGAVLELCHVTKRFAVSKAAGTTITALDDVSFSLSSGECVLIGGSNGSGKSVLMDIIAGLSKPTEGSVLLTDSSGKTTAAGLVFQDADTQILGETPLEDAIQGPLNMKVNKHLAKEFALRALQQTGLGSKTAYPARFLSGGEKRRLAVAGILAMNRSLVIFDEPYANLDYSGVKQVNSLVTMLKREGRTVIILTHELEKSLALCTRFIVLYHGKKVFDGTPTQGLSADLNAWEIHNPVAAYNSLEDLVWL